MIAIIDGFKIENEADFHREIAKLIDFGPYYGKNFDALWDAMTANIERPLTLIWENSEHSRIQMGDDFYIIVNILRDAEKFDKSNNLKEVFELLLK